MHARDIASALLGLLWPERCAACGAPFDAPGPRAVDRVFCAPCATSVIEQPAACCPRCSLPFDGAGPAHLCGDCLLYPPPFDGVRSAFLYGGAMADAVTRFKYGPRPVLARPLGLLAAEAITRVEAAELVVPVPLSRRRLCERGFNQSALLAPPVARRAGKLPFDAVALSRVKETPHQASLSRTARLASLHGVFCVTDKRRVLGKRVLLVDDVVTTTATARAATLALLDAGAAGVTVLCLARTPR